MEINLKVWFAGAADKVTTTALEYLSWWNHWLIADLESHTSLNLIPKDSQNQDQMTLYMPLVINRPNNNQFSLCACLTEHWSKDEARRVVVVCNRATATAATHK